MITRIILGIFIFFSISTTNIHLVQAHQILSSNIYSGLVINSDTGEVLYSHSANAIRHPASLTKIMTLYIVFEALSKGKIHLQSKIKISNSASNQAPSNLGVKPGSTITVEEAIQALIVKSANDVAYAVAENLGGNIDEFAKIMNQKAKQIGMKNTRFYNPHGLFHQDQCTTAYDMARLAIAMQRHHHRYYHLFAMKSFKFKNRIIRSHNHVLLKYKPATGLKTGFINASGFNVVTTARKPEGNLIAVVMGGQTAKIRDDHMINLLQSGYSKLSNRGFGHNNHNRSLNYEAVKTNTKHNDRINNQSKINKNVNAKDNFSNVGYINDHFGNNHLKQDVFSVLDIRKKK